METLGIDLSADPKRTAACRIEWKRARAEVTGLWPETSKGKLDDGELLALVVDSDKAAIDSPFGWPKPFVQAIGRWSRCQGWTNEERPALRYRATDRQVVEPRGPLSVSSDRIGATAMRCAALLEQLPTHGVEVDRAGVLPPRRARSHPLRGSDPGGMSSMS